jgi:hypothetical protein
MKIQTLGLTRSAVHLLFLFLAWGMLSCSPDKEVMLQVYNPLDQARTDAIILLSRGEIERWTSVPDGRWPVLKDPSGNYIPAQVDDLDGDGAWDELFAMTDLGAGEQRKISLGFTPSESYPEFQVRTNLHLGDARDQYRKLDRAGRLEWVSYHNYENRTSAEFQMEGPAWENDLVGFRNYLDQRNGMDIFGKTTSSMVLDRVGLPGEPSYHEPGDWGQDVLKVGSSLGAGGIAYMYNDSIYRVGDNGSGTYEVRIRGPLRSRFNLNYENWHAGDQVLEVTHQVEIVAGRRCYQGLVSYKGSDAPLTLVVGIVNMLSDRLHVLELDANYTGLYTLDRQAEDSSYLAMALVVPTRDLVGTGETENEGDGVIQTYYALLDASPGSWVPYRFYALWEKESPRWRSGEEIEAYLKTEAERWSQSVIFPDKL